MIDAVSKLNAFDPDDGAVPSIDYSGKSFFIIGAPRCGTTSLSRYLRKHRQISFSKPKETHFFLNSHQIASDQQMRNTYLSHFHPKLAEHHLAIGDGSVSHLYSDDAIKEILRFDPEARFIVLTRNPIDLVQSYHRRLLYTLDEDVRDFPTAWQLQPERAAGKSLPKKCRDPRLLRYEDIGKIGSRIENLLRHVPREQCLIILFDEFISSPLAVYRKALAFIGLDYDGRTEFPVYAAQSEFRSKAVQALVMNPPSWVLKLLTLQKGNLRQRLKRLKGARRRLMSLNATNKTMKPAKETMPGQLREELKEHFREDVSILEDIVKVDLQHWR
ncbi:MAG: sulfotransferase family protein [Geminicoccaceae bacterium]